MTVAELMEILAQYPTDMKVVVEGFECDYEEIDFHRIINTSEGEAICLG